MARPTMEPQGQRKWARWALVHIVPATLFLVISLMIFSRVLGAEGEFVNGDLERPTTLDRLWNYIYPLWSEAESTSVITRLPQLLYSLPFFVAGALFGLDTTGVLTLEFVVSQATMGIAMYYLSRYVLGRSYGVPSSRFDRRIWIAAIVAGFAYMWSSYPTFHILHPAMRGAYSLAPLVLLTLLVGLETRKMRYIVLTGFLWSVCCADIHWMVYGGLFVFCVLLFNFVADSAKGYRKAPKKGVLRAVKSPFILHLRSLLLTMGSFLAFSAYWFVPGLYMKGTTMFSIPLRDEYLEMWYRDSTVVNAMNNQAMGAGTPEVYEASAGIFASGSMQAALAILGVGVFTTAILAFALRPRSRNVRFFSLFLILSIAISTGLNVFPEASMWLIRDAPLHEVYGWAFRTPKFSEFITFSAVGLLGFAVFELMTWAVRKERKGAGKARKVCATAVIALLLCSVVLPNWPMATGNYNEALTPVDMPDEFQQLDDWFAEKEGDFKVLWLPKYLGRTVDWNEGQRTNKDMAALSSSRPSYVYDTPHMNPNGYGSFFLEATANDLSYHSLLGDNMTGNIGKVLSPLNVRYVVFHDDSTISPIKTTVLLGTLASQKDLRLVRTFGFLYVFENLCYGERTGQRFFTTSTEHLVFGGVSSMDTLTEVPTFEPWSDGVVFGGEVGLDRELINRSIDDFVFTQGTGKVDLVFETVSDEDLVVPYNFVEAYEPDVRWSKAPSYEFMNDRNTQKGDLAQWNWDRGMGVAYTWSKGTLRKDQSLTDKDLMRYYSFDENVGDFKAGTPDVTIGLEAATEGVGSTLKGAVARGEPGMVQEARTEQIRTKGGFDYRFSFSLAVQDANNAQVVVSSYDADGRPVRNQFLLTKSGTYDKEIVAANVSFPFGVEYFSVRVLADKNPITNSSWKLDDLRIYDLGNLIETPSMKLDFEVEDAGMQDVYVRCLRNVKGGRIDLSIDGEPFGKVVTLSPTGAFEWVHAGNVMMSRGHHTIEIGNVVGFNAVNLISVIPKERFTEGLQRAQELMDGKGIILAFEAERSLAADDLAPAEMSRAYGNAAGMGFALKMSADEVRTSIDVPRSGNYTLSIRLAGQTQNNLLAVDIGGKEHRIGYNASDELGWFNITNVRLDAGKQEISFSLPERGERSGTLSFEEGLNATTGLPVGCGPAGTGFDVSLDGSARTDGNMGLRIRTADVTAGNWSWMRCGELPVETGKWYEAGVDVRTVNTAQTQVIVYGFDEGAGTYTRLKNIATGLNGTNDWGRYSAIFKVPENVTKVAFTLNAGGVGDQAQGYAASWFDNITLDRYYRDQRTALDMFFLSLDPDGGGLWDMFGRPPVAIIKDYKQIGDGRYQVEVSSTGQFVLGFAETYDEHWDAALQNGLSFDGLPLNGMVNGYSVNRTGNFTIILEYAPQKWFNVGVGTTITAGAICAVWLLWVGVIVRWRSGRGKKEKMGNMGSDGP